MAALKSKCVIGGGPYGLGGGQEPLRCVSALGVTGARYDQSGEAMAEVPALSPRPVVPPESALLAVPAAMTPPEADPHQ